jgi:hypothetical protein
MKNAVDKESFDKRRNDICTVTGLSIGLAYEAVMISGVNANQCDVLLGIQSINTTGERLVVTHPIKTSGVLIGPLFISVSNRWQHSTYVRCVGVSI